MEMFEKFYAGQCNGKESKWFIKKLVSDKTFLAQYEAFKAEKERQWEKKWEMEGKDLDEIPLLSDKNLIISSVVRELTADELSDYEYRERAILEHIRSLDTRPEKRPLRWYGRIAASTESNADNILNGDYDELIPIWIKKNELS